MEIVFENKQNQKILLDIELNKKNIPILDNNWNEQIHPENEENNISNFIDKHNTPLENNENEQIHSENKENNNNINNDESNIPISSSEESQNITASNPNPFLYNLTLANNIEYELNENNASETTEGETQINMMNMAFNAFENTINNGFFPEEENDDNVNNINNNCNIEDIVQNPNFDNFTSNYGICKKWKYSITR